VQPTDMSAQPNMSAPFENLSTRAASVHPFRANLVRQSGPSRIDRRDDGTILSQAEAQLR